MDIGIGLPTTVPGGRGPAALDWARGAEERGFSSVAVLDRLVYDNLEPVVALAAAAGATSRVRLTFSVLLAAYRGNAALLAKQLDSLVRLAGDRVALGVAAGGRPDDFEASGVDYHRRGRLLDELLEQLPAGLEVLVGGHSEAALRRFARRGDGWIAGGSSVRAYQDRVAAAASAWQESGRAGRPRMVALTYFCLGPGAAAKAEAYLSDYYSYFGPAVSRVLEHAVTDEEKLAEVLGTYEAAGCDELLLFPCDADPAQLDRVAEAVQSSKTRSVAQQASASAVRT